MKNKYSQILEKAIQSRKQVPSLETILDGVDLLKEYWSKDKSQNNEELLSILDRKALQIKIDKELNSFKKNYEPLGILLHVISGNVYLAGVGSLIEGLLTRNVNIIKMPSQGPHFLPIFLESIQKVAPKLLPMVQLVQYSSSDEKTLDLFKNSVDGIVIWGGEQAVQSYRNNLPARTRVIVFGPKYSLAIISKENLQMSQDFKLLSEKLATDISMWDQKACTAPQMCFVEGKENAILFAKTLNQALEEKYKTQPGSPIDIHEATEIQKFRGEYAVAEALGKAQLFHSAELMGTVVYDSQKELLPSPLNRTIRISSFENIQELETPLSEMRGYLQTAGITSASVKSFLKWMGVLRFTAIGEMNGGKVDDPHDGQFDLTQLVNFIAEEEALDDAFINLIEIAKRSPFYSRRLSEKSITSLKDLSKIPILTRQDMEKNMPPQGQGLSTGLSYGGYVARSGGSTGAPKFSIYDAADWEELVSSGVELLKACGLKKGDRVANCFLAGDLYGSFVSFDHINYRIGVQTFAFAGQVNPELFLDMVKKFNINVIEALPTVIIPLFRIIKQMDPSFTFEKVIFGGAPMSKSDREWLMTQIKCKSVRSIIGANDGGQIGYQCEHLTGLYHHSIDEFNYLEVVDEHGKQVEEGVAGELVITSLKKVAYPLIRYSLGDKARFISEKCPCSNRRVFEYLGRADDMLCLGTMNLKYSDIETALKEEPISALQVIGKNDELGEYLVLRLETEEQSIKFKTKINDLLYQKVPVLKRQIEQAHLHRMEIELYLPGGLPRNQRSGKIKTVVDERL